MENKVSIAIVGGTGNLGKALALRLAAPGVRVIIGSRDLEKARSVVNSLIQTLGDRNIEGKTNQEAVKEADFVVIATPYEGHSKTVSDLSEDINNKIIIDAVVPLNKGKPFIPSAGSALLEAQEILGSGISLVGALHNISAVDLQDPHASLGDVLVCGDNIDAKKRVMEFIRMLGATAFDAGPAANAYIVEGMTGVLIYLNRIHKSKHASLKITGIGD